MNMYRQQRYDECIKEVKSKLKQSPNSLHLLNYQAMAYSALKKDREALMSYQKIIKKDPSLAGPYYNMGVILKRTGRVKEAMDSYKRAISLKNDYVQAYNNLGVLYKDNEKYENAIKMFTKAKEIQPDHQNSYFNLALIKKEQGLIEEALKLLLKVLDINPEHNEANFLYGLISITIDNLKEGWKYFEYRWKVSPGNKTTWPFQDKPVWKGERGKRVVLWKEQGIGDQIIFLSLVKEVKAMCSSLSVYVDPRLGSLCRRAMPEIDFIPNEKELERAKCDYHLPIQSIGGLIRNDISDFDRSVKGYLKADPQRVEAIRDELNLAGKTVIGISWRSFNTRYKTKSVQLRDMERIFSDLDVVLVNLQYGDVDDEIRAFKEETGIDVLQCASVDNREDLDGLAALIEACDLVISTSNVTVHMAGALAKETWVLLPYVMVNFWWLLERPDSIWYPTLRLYRQTSLNDWNSVYSAIRKDLQRKLIKT